MRNSKPPDDLADRIPKAAACLQRHPSVVFAYLFGSMAMGKVTPMSDVDIAVYLSGDSPFGEDKMEILASLVKTLETDDLDVVILNSADLPLQARIIGNKKVLVDKDPYARHRFESLVMRKYADFSVKEMQVFKRRYSLG